MILGRVSEGGADGFADDAGEVFTQAVQVFAHAVDAALNAAQARFDAIQTGFNAVEALIDGVKPGNRFVFERNQILMHGFDLLGQKAERAFERIDAAFEFENFGFHVHVRSLAQEHGF